MKSPIKDPTPSLQINNKKGTVTIFNPNLTIAEQARDAVGAMFLKQITDRGDQIEIPSLGITIKIGETEK